MQSHSHAFSFSVTLSCTHSLSHSLTPFLMPLLMTPPHFLQPCALSCGLVLILSHALACNFSCHLSPHAVSFQHTVFIHVISLCFLEHLLSHALSLFLSFSFSLSLSLIHILSCPLLFSHFHTLSCSLSHFLTTLCLFLQVYGLSCSLAPQQPHILSCSLTFSRSHNLFLAFSGTQYFFNFLPHSLSFYLSLT